MSGIFGLLNLANGPVCKKTFRNMMEVASYSGRDGTGVFENPGISLGNHQRFDTPESVRETLPLESEFTDTVIVCDARLDNRDDLIQKLNGSNSQTDGEIILGAYEKWGEKCPEHLLGDFAFAIWDGTERKLLLVRDQRGSKIIYYNSSGDSFAFSSEYAAMRSLPEVSGRLDERHVVSNYVRKGLLSTAQESTAYQEIRRIPPATAIVVSRRGVQKKLYWDLRNCIDKRPIYSNAAECYEQFRDLFTEAVSCRLRSNNPVGAHLSGGLDSSAVACIAAGLSPSSELNCFSAVAPEGFTDENLKSGKSIDEKPFVESVLQQYPKINVSYFDGNTHEISDYLGDLFYYTGYNAINLWNRLWANEISSSAAGLGIRNILTGGVGNITVSRRPWRRGRLLGRIKRLIFPNRVDVLENTAIRQELVEALGISKLRLPGQSPFRTLSKSSGHLAAYEVARSNIVMLDPTNDLRIVEFCLSVPNEYLEGPDGSRLLVRNGLKGILPDKIRLRESRGVQSPDRIRRAEQLAPKILEQLKEMSKNEKVSYFIDINRIGGPGSESGADQKGRHNYLDKLFKTFALARFLKQA